MARHAGTRKGAERDEVRQRRGGPKRPKITQDNHSGRLFGSTNKGTVLNRMGEHDDRFVTGTTAALCSWLLTKWSDALLSLLILFMQGTSGNLMHHRCLRNAQGGFLYSYCCEGGGKRSRDLGMAAILRPSVRPGLVFVSSLD